MKNLAKKSKDRLEEHIADFPLEVKKYIRAITKKNHKILKEINDIFVSMDRKLDSFIKK